MTPKRTLTTHTLSIFIAACIAIAIVFPLSASTYLPLLFAPTPTPKRAVAASMSVGSASPLLANQTSALDGCFDLAMDRLDTDQTSASRWFAIATCQFSESSYGHRAGIITDANGVLSFSQIGIENTYFDDREVKVRIVSSLVAEPAVGGWQIVSVLLNEVKRENGTLFSGFLSDAELSNPGYIFNFGDESAAIFAGQLELVRGERDPEVPEHFVLFAAAGRSDQEVFDHSSGWHQVLVPYESVLDITTHKLITGRDSAGNLTFLTDPWGVNFPTVDAWNGANREAAAPEDNPSTGEPWWLVWPGTYTRLSDKEDIFQGGVMNTMIDGQRVYIACHSGGTKRWHPDVHKRSWPPKVDCQAAAKLGIEPVDTGTVDLSFQGTGDFSPGWFWHLLDNVSGNDFIGISSLNMEPHQMPVTFNLTLVEE